MPTRAITVRAFDFDGLTPLAKAQVRVELVNPGADHVGLVFGKDIVTHTDETGQVVLQLWENNGSYSNTYYTARVYHPDTQKLMIDRARFQVRDSDAFLHDLIDLSVDQPKNITEERIAQVLGARAAVESMRDEAQIAANTATQAVSDITTHVQTATDKAGEATTAAQTATTKAGEASSSATTASDQAGIATQAANEASADADAIALVEAGINTTAGQVQTNRDDSVSAKNAAIAARDLAQDYRDEAEGFRDTASQKASDIQGQAALVEQWANAAENIEVEPGKYSTNHFYQKVIGLHNQVQNLTAAAIGGFSFAGEYNASSGSAPVAPQSGAVFYRISVAGTINGEDYEPGDNITYNPNTETWFKEDNTERFTSINGQTSGAVTITFASIGALGANQAAVDSVKLNNQLPSYYLDWANFNNKPSTFPPAAHSHTAQDIGALPSGATAADSSKLGGIAASQYFRQGSGPSISDVTGLEDKLNEAMGYSVAAAAFAMGNE